MSYQTALNRLLACESKKLARGRYTSSRSGSHCVIGEICPKFVQCKGYRRVDDLPEDWLAGSGLTVREAQNMQDANDRFEGTEEQRYEVMVSWLRVHVVMETLD